MCALSSSYGIIIVVGCTIVLWPHHCHHGQWAVTCSHGVVVYTGVEKRGGLWDEMCEAMAKMNHNKHHGLCFVMHLLPRTVSWGHLYHIIAPTKEVGSPHYGWLVMLALDRRVVS